MLTLLDDSCWRNPTGTQRAGGGGCNGGWGDAEIKTKRGKADEERGQGQKEGSEERAMIKKLS